MTHDDADARFDELPRVLRVRIRREDHWYWTGQLHMSRSMGAHKSYGSVYLPQSQRQGRRSPKALVHRLVYELLVGPLGTLTVDHLCGETLCCRPSHLEAVSIVENSERRWHVPSRDWTPTTEDRYPLHFRSATAWTQPDLQEFP